MSTPPIWHVAPHATRLEVSRDEGGGAVFALALTLHWTAGANLEGSLTLQPIALDEEGAEKALGEVGCRVVPGQAGPTVTLDEAPAVEAPARLRLRLWVMRAGGAPTEVGEADLAIEPEPGSWLAFKIPEEDYRTPSLVPLAEEPLGKLHVILRDEADAPLAGSAVEVGSPAGWSWSGTTDAAGEVRLPYLPYGYCTLEVDGASHAVPVLHLADSPHPIWKGELDATPEPSWAQVDELLEALRTPEGEVEWEPLEEDQDLASDLVLEVNESPSG